MSNVIDGKFPVALKLEAKNPAEQCVLEYLSENASDVLVGKINDGKKTLRGSLSYAKSEAKKMAKNGAGCVMVEDATVFGWIIHYFEEDEIKESKKSATRLPKNVVKKTQPKKKAKPQKASTGPIMLELFPEFVTQEGAVS